MALSKIYSDIRQKLLATGEFKHVDIYNSQDVSLDDELHFATPAAFISFKNLRYTSLPQDWQEIEGNIWIKIVNHSLKPEFDKIYTLAELCNQEIHNMRDPDDLYGPITRVGATQDENFQGYQIFDVWYEFRALDEPTVELVKTFIAVLETTTTLSLYNIEFNGNEFNSNEFF